MALTIAGIVVAALLLLAACDSEALPTPRPSPTTVQPTATEVLPSATRPTAPEITSTPASAPSTLTPSLPASGGVMGCIATGSRASLDSIGDPFYPELGNAGYDTQHYVLDLSTNADLEAVSGTVTILAQALQDLDAFNLDFQGLEIRDLRVNGATATYERDGHELQITPPEPLKNGEPFTVTVAYRGMPEPPPVAGTTLELGWVNYGSGVYVASEPDGAASWYPVNDHPCDKATYTLRITVPKPYVVAANGLLRDTIDNADTTTYVWETTNPVASYLVTVNIAEFVEEKQSGPDGLPMRNYFPRGLDDDTKAKFDRMPEMVEYFNGIFGPYPFEAYGAVVADTNIGFALETQTLSLFGTGIGLGRSSAEETLAHELAHQWFGDSVSLKTWKDIWLNEGFATYGQWLWLEHKEGRDALDERIREMYSAVRDEEPPPPGSPPPDELFNMGVYVRGGLTLHALRVRIGDDAFFEILRTYAELYRYGNADTADFIKVAEEVSGQELSEFFDGWLYQARIPEIPEMGLQP